MLALVSIWGEPRFQHQFEITNTIWKYQAMITKYTRISVLGHWRMLCETEYGKYLQAGEGKTSGWDWNNQTDQWVWHKTVGYSACNFPKERKERRRHGQASWKIKYHGAQ